MTSIFQSARSRRHSNGALRDLESNVEDQIEALRDELAELTRLIGKGSRHGSERIRHQAAAGYDELLDRSEELLHELQEGYRRGAKEMRATVRRHPLATVGAAAALGLVIALFARR
ncbi:DUF883 family protein [Rhizobium binxianense]